MHPDFPRLREQLELSILARTGRRILNLDIKLSSDGIILHGQTQTFYVKQLAQQSVRDMLPDIQLQNAIQVA